MKRRRLFALLTSVATLHFSVVGTDAACQPHASASQRAVSANEAATATHDMPMAGHAMPAAQRSGAPTASVGSLASSATPPCEVPTQRHCCDALVGCSVDAAVTSAHEGVGVGATSSARILVARHDAPASFDSAPEPPPPKA